MGKFSLDLSKFAEDANDANEDIIRATAIELFTSIIMDTPVDTGRARANWFATGVNPSTATTKSVDKTGSASISKMISRVASLSNAEIIQLTNNLPYIDRLEDGYSWEKAPDGMVKKNIIRLESILEQEARKRKL